MCFHDLFVVCHQLVINCHLEKFVSQDTQSKLEHVSSVFNLCTLSDNK